MERQQKSYLKGMNKILLDHDQFMSQIRGHLTTWQRGSRYKILSPPPPPLESMSEYSTNQTCSGREKKNYQMKGDSTQQRKNTLEN